jgi:transposase InsO family protein
MSARDRRAKVERTGSELSVRRQCALLSVARSGVYRPRREPNAEDLALMRRIDELYLEKPFYGSRRMTFDLNEEGRGVNRKRVQRLMRLMGLEALVPRPGTSKAAPGNKIYPYLLRGVTISEPNHVWASDITYIAMANGFLYLTAIIDWASRAVLAWRLSNTMDSASRRWTRRFNDTASPGYSTPTKAHSSPAPRSRASWRRPGSRFRWTGAAVSWTTFSSSGCGARSNTKRSI